MATILKATPGIDSRWTECLEHDFPYNDTELGDSLLTIVAHVVKGTPQIWLENKTLNGKGRKASTVDKLREAQAKFQRHQGELVSLVLVHNAWSKIPKRERPNWCQQNCVDNAILSQLEEVALNIRREIQSVRKRRPSRLSVETSAPDDETLLERLALLLMKVFPDCLYKKWHTGKKYFNCATSKTKLVDFSDMPRGPNVDLPDYVLCLPDSSSDVSLVVSTVVAQGSRASCFMGQFPEIKHCMPVEVVLPDMGDAVILQLAGGKNGIKELEKSISQLCDQEDLLLSVEVHEPEDVHSWWKLVIYCPAMFKTHVEKVMAEKVRVVMAELESDAKTVFFPDLSSEFRLLVGAGGQVQVVSGDQDLVLVHIMRPEENVSSAHGRASNVAPSDSEVIEALEAYAKLGKVERLGKFPNETLWGAVWFKYRSSAINVCRKGEAVTLPGTFKMKLVHVDSNVPLFGCEFYWWRTNVTKSELHMHFLREEDFNRFKKKHFPYRKLGYEFNADEMKVTVTSTNPDDSVWEQVRWDCEKTAFPKCINYTHRAVSEVRQEDVELLEEGLPAHCANYHFEDPGELFVIVEPPSQGASVIEGTVYGYHGKQFAGMDQQLGFPFTHDYDACGGELSTRWTYMKFTMPEEAYEKVKSQLEEAVRRKPKERRNVQQRRNEVENQHIGHGQQANAGEQNENSESDASSSEGEGNEHDRNAEVIADGENARGQNDQPVEKEDSEEGHIVVKPIGNLVQVKIDVETPYVRREDIPEFKKVPLLVKPHILHLRGDVLAYLSADNAKINQPNFTQIMNATDTFIDIMKEKSLIHIYGTSDNVEAAKERIRKAVLDFMKPKVKSKARSRKSENTSYTSSNLTKCVMCQACHCETKQREFRLSLCGHSFCRPCFRDLVKKAMDTKHFPIRCSAENCSRQVLMVDIEASFAHYNMSMTDLYVTSMQPMNTLRPCPTKDCPMMYHPNYVEEHGMVHCFSCPLCKEAWCMSCLCPFHFGMSCTVHNAVKADSKLKEWLEEAPDSRKLCPDCLKGIDMTPFSRGYTICSACKASICWYCMKTSKRFSIKNHHCAVNFEAMQQY